MKNRDRLLLPELGKNIFGHVQNSSHERKIKTTAKTEGILSPVFPTPVGIQNPEVTIGPHSSQGE